MYIYLHGFASGPESAKASYFREQFALIGIALVVPDLNLGDFSHLTISRQIAQVVDLLPADRWRSLSGGESPVTLIGSSLGGLTAAKIAIDYPQVERLILLAPAFDFLTHWLPKIGAQQLKLWEQDSYLPIYHHAEKKLLPLHYNFLVDAHRYHVTQSDRIFPTLIIHGIDDDVIPISASRNFASIHPWVELVEVDSNHALTNVSAEIWQEICRFCQFLPVT